MAPLKTLTVKILGPLMLLAVLAHCSRLPGREQSTTQISHGKEARTYSQEIGNTDWVGLIETKVGGQTARCTGSLIAPQVVLTAAHCLVDGAGRLIKNKSIQVSFRHESHSGLTRYRVEAMSVHPRFIRSRDWGAGVLKIYDLGLVRLETEVAPMFRRQLPQVVFDTEKLRDLGIPGGSFHFLGFAPQGFTSDSHGLNFGTAKSVSMQICGPKIKEYITRAATERGERVPKFAIPFESPTQPAGQYPVDHFCALAGGQGPTAHPGDSGGPAIVISDGNQSLVGVISSGNSSGHSTGPLDVEKIAGFETFDRKETKKWMVKFLNQSTQRCQPCGCLVQ